MLKQSRALSPVVASIILIAATVAVSISVAAWMGALTFTFVETDQSVHTFMTMPIHSEFNAYCVIWEWSYHYSVTQFRSNMTALPTNMTIDISQIPLGTELEIKVYYYNITDNWFMFFSYLGERDFVFIIH